ncbi:MAG: type II toxin-antitoxin system VapC family toxin [Actinobacteria bacterium]|nr:MAG: type II toxin-antitoxin system VapC family toxin [Actinomycetota bacterium]
MAPVVLDTTVLIDLLRGRPETARRLRALRDAGDSPCTCAVNVEETVRGLRPAERDPVRRLFAGLRIVPLGESEGWQAGEWRREHSRRGRTLTQADSRGLLRRRPARDRKREGFPDERPGRRALAGRILRCSLGSGLDEMKSGVPRRHDAMSRIPGVRRLDRSPLNSGPRSARTLPPAAPGRANRVPASASPAGPRGSP